MDKSTKSRYQLRQIPASWRNGRRYGLKIRCGDSKKAGKPAKTPTESKSFPQPFPFSPSDPELASIVQAWPNLPGPIRAGILAMVKAAKG
jgi:hypothetical protein